MISSLRFPCPVCLAEEADFGHISSHLEEIAELSLPELEDYKSMYNAKIGAKVPPSLTGASLHKQLPRIAIAGTNGLAYWIAHYLTEINSSFVILSRSVSAVLVTRSFDLAERPSRLNHTLLLVDCR